MTEDEIKSLIENKQSQNELRTQTVIDFNKENYKNVINVYYSSQANFDKLVMTIFFGEIGYVAHTIKDGLFHISFIITMLISAFGIFFAIKRYDVDLKALSFEKEKISAETRDLIEINDYSGDIYKLDSAINGLNKLSDKYLFFIKSIIVCSSITTVETVYFIKQNISNTSLLLSTLALIMVISLINYYGGKK